MSCLICAGSAERVQCQGDWEERNCPSCGRYRIPDALVLTLMEQGQIFDVVKMRKWLADQRIDNAIPCIEMHKAFLME